MLLLRKFGGVRAVAGATLYALAEGRNKRRAAVSVAFALVFFGPVCGLYYPATERLIGPCVARKLVFDQIVFSPTWHAAYCLVHAPHIPFASAKQGVDLAVHGWPVWSAIHLVTYTTVPVHLRASWVLLCDAAWVSWVSRKQRNTKL